MNPKRSEAGSGTWVLPRAAEEVRIRLAARLVSDGLVSADKLEELEHRAKWLDEGLVYLIRKEKLVDPDRLLELLSEVAGLPFIHMANTTIDPAAVEYVPPRIAAYYRVMPIAREGDRLILATSRLYDVKESDKLQVLLGCTLEWVLCREHEITMSIKHYYGVGLGAFVGLKEVDEAGAVEVVSPGGEPGDGADIVSFVEQVIDDAVQSNASDIHVEPMESELRLRYRIDGILYPIPLPRGATQYQRAIVSRLKVMAQINISERRLPQDGRFATRVAGESLDIRVSVLPTRHGETVNLRILNRETTFMTLAELGLHASQRTLLEEAISLPNGMVLFVGATGCGKTTSLYAALDQLNSDDRKIITIEDPVEYQIQGVTQMQVNSEIGFTFATGLRSILRHDPDVVLIGEIRDRETADIAVSAALTGHLVFSTLHTNNSTSALTRLLDMRVPPYLLTSSVRAIAAQRLVRRVCITCRQRRELEPPLLETVRREYPALPDDAVFYRERGCPDCRYTGYKGRQAIFEVMPMTDEVRSLVVQRASSATLMNQALHEGMITLRESGWRCAAKGITSVSDVLRVTRRSEARDPRGRPHSSREDTPR